MKPIPNEISKSSTLLFQYLKKVALSKAFWGAFMFFSFLSFSFYWDGQALVFRLTSHQYSFPDAETAFQSIFFEYYGYWWTTLMVFFILPKLLFTLRKSFTISETLWIKFNQTSNTTLIITRVLFILGSAGFVLLVSLIWALLFSVYYGVSFSVLYVPILVLLGHILFATGITLWVCSSHRLRSDLGMLLTFLALTIPILFEPLKTRFRQLGDFFPHSMPLSLSQTLPSTETAYSCASLLGLALIFLFSFVRNVKPFKQ